MRPKKLELADLCSKVSAQEKLHERHEELPPPRLPDIEWRSVVAKVLPPSQLAREATRAWLVPYLEQLLVLLQGCPRLKEVVEELCKEF